MNRKRWSIGLVATVLVITMLPAASAAAGPVPAWTRQFGSDADDFVSGVAVDSSGGFAVVGDTEGTVAGGTNRGQHDAFVRVIGRGGRHAWTRQFGSGEIDAAWDVAVDARDRVIIAGFTEGSLPGRSSRGAGDAFVRVYQRSGRHAWTRQFGTTGDDEATAVAVDGRGRIVVVGYTWGILAGNKNRGRGDVFVRVYKPGGGVAWTRQFGSAEDDVAWDVAVDNQGRIIVVGYTRGALPGKVSAGAEDAFVRVYKPSGRLAWTRQFGTTEREHAYGVAIGASGRINVVGSTTGSLTTSWGQEDGFLRVFQRGGRVIWTHQLGTSSADDARAVAVDGKQRILVVGTTRGSLSGQGSHQGQGDGYVRALSAFGRVVWTHQFGTAGDDRARSLAVDRRNRIAVAGYTDGPLTNQPQGGSDGFLRVYRQ